MAQGRGKRGLLIREEEADVPAEVGGTNGHDVVEGDDTVEREASAGTDCEFGRQALCA